MARVLLKNFDRVYVVTLPTDPLPKELIDETFGAEEFANERLQVIAVAPLLDGYGFVAKPRMLQRIVGALMTRALCSSGGDWIVPLSAALARISDEARVEIVVSTGGPFAPFLPVVRFATKAGIPAIIDYRDLWTENPRAPFPVLSRFLVRKTLERYVNRRCSIITTVSHGCRQSLAGAHPECAIETLMNTPDPEYAAWFHQQSTGSDSRFDRECLNIVLAGTVYRECTCRLLVQAVLLLPPQLRARVRLHYLGMSTDLVRSEFLESGLAANLVEQGFVKKMDAVAAVKRADVLLSLVFDSTVGPASSAVLGLMTTKVFDYFLSGKPIINVGPPNADICTLAREIGYAEFYSFESRDVGELACFIESALENLGGFRQRVATARLPDFATRFEQILAHVHAITPAERQ